MKLESVFEWGGFYYGVKRTNRISKSGKAYADKYYKSKDIDFPKSASTSITQDEYLETCNNIASIIGADWFNQIKC